MTCSASLSAMAEYSTQIIPFMQAVSPLYLAVQRGIAGYYRGPFPTSWAGVMCCCWGCDNMFADGRALRAHDACFSRSLRSGRSWPYSIGAWSRAVVRDSSPGTKAASMMAMSRWALALVPMISPAVGGFAGTVVWRGSKLLGNVSGSADWCWRLQWFDFANPIVARAATTWPTILPEVPELTRLSAVLGVFDWRKACCSARSVAYLGGAPFVGSVSFGIGNAELVFISVRRRGLLPWQFITPESNGRRVNTPGAVRLSGQCRSVASVLC